jgi:predicted ferric reductase
VPAPAGNPQAEHGVPFLPFVIAIFLGAVVALLTIPAWVPVLGGSVIGAEPKVYWYLSRATGLVGFALLWVSMASGLIISNKMARIWPGNWTAFDLHQYTSLLGPGFGVIHALVLLGNAFVPYSLVQLIVPFTNDQYRPVWVSLGQIGIYMSALVSFTFYVRKQIGNYAWRLIHYSSYIMFGLVLLHGLLSGTDSGNVWIANMYWISAISVVALTAYRVVVAKAAPARSQG